MVKPRRQRKPRKANKSNAIGSHNFLRGRVIRASNTCKAVMRASTTTESAKRAAGQALSYLELTATLMETQLPPPE